MIVAWMLYALLVATLVAVVAVGLEAVFRTARLPIRGIWAGAMLLTLGLVATAPARIAPPAPLRTGSVTALFEATPASGAVAGRSLLARVAAVPDQAVRLLEAGLATVGRRTPTGVGVTLLLLASLASLAVLGVICTTHRRSRRQRQRWPASEVGGLRVRVAPDVGPAVMGVARPEIVVPRWFFQLSTTESRLVVAHEEEHVRVHDPMLLALGWTVVALLAWNPTAWWMLARLRLAVELDCDSRVLRGGADARSYGSVLIDLAGRSAQLQLGMLSLTDPPSQLERRLIAMTYRPTRLAVARGTALASLALVAALAACAAELPTAAQLQALDVATAEQAAARASLIEQGDASSIYTLDGVVVTGAEARAVAPEKIEAVSIQRATAPGGSSRVAIVTRAGAAAAGSAVSIPGVLVEPLSDSSRAALTVRAAPGGVSVRVRGDAGEVGAQPVYLVDGVRRAGLEGLEPGTIESISVFKGASAVTIGGPDAANGLIVVRTKGGPDDGLDLEPVAAAPTGVRVRGTSQIAPRVRLAPGVQPVYLVDGVRISEAEFNALDTSRIESVNVIKDPQAGVKLVGPDGKDGVVDIRTKGAAR